MSKTTKTLCWTGIIVVILVAVVLIVNEADIMLRRGFDRTGNIAADLLRADARHLDPTLFAAAFEARFPIGSSFPTALEFLEGLSTHECLDRSEDQSVYSCSVVLWSRICESEMLYVELSQENGKLVAIEVKPGWEGC